MKKKQSGFTLTDSFAAVAIGGLLLAAGIVAGKSRVDNFTRGDNIKQVVVLGQALAQLAPQISTAPVIDVTSLYKLGVIEKRFVQSACLTGVCAPGTPGINPWGGALTLSGADTLVAGDKGGIAISMAGLSGRVCGELVSSAVSGANFYRADVNGVDIGLKSASPGAITAACAAGGTVSLYVAR